jgi:two-component system heavy metal sensor histidine kinase CusS
MMTAKRQPISLTLRVLLFVGAAIAAGLMLNITLIERSVRHHFAEQDASELQAIADSLLNVMPQPGEDLHRTLMPWLSGHHGVELQLEAASGELLYQASSAGFAAAAADIAPVRRITPDNLQTWQAGEHTFRGAVMELNDQRLTLAVDMGFHLHFLHSFRHSLWLIMAATALLTLLAAAFAIYQGHIPLRGFSRNLRSTQSSNLDNRIDPNSLPVELSDLALSFNEMAARLQHSFDQLSHFSADIAHELRTPLTNLMTQIQVTLSKPREPSTYHELLYSSLEELERLSKMVGDMLWLAKSDNRLLALQRQPLNLADEVAELFEFFEALAAEQGVTLALQGSAEVAADRHLLRRALSNLLSNALRYTPAGGCITVTLACTADRRVRITVSNPGEAIAVEHLDKLFDRFYRADPSRQRQSEGAGLGLAIVRAVVDAHGGTVGVTSDQQTTRFTIELTR